MHFIGCQNVGTFFAKKYQAMGTGQEHGSTQFDLSPSPFMLINNFCQKKERPNILAYVFYVFPVLGH